MTKKSFTRRTVDHRVARAQERAAVATHELLREANKRLIVARQAISTAVIANIHPFGDIRAPDRILEQLSKALSLLGESNDLLLEIHDRLIDQRKGKI